jgi:riboflavin kinase/FMN adenylyltransferase
MNGTGMPLVVSDPRELNLPGAVIAIGNFDGVHVGHRALLRRMQQLSLELDAPAVILSFFPTSRLVFTPVSYLSSAAEKVSLFAGFAPAAVVLVPFSREYAQTDKSVFLAQLERFKPAAIIVGEDFRFGHERAGTLNDLSLVTPKLEVFGLESLNGSVVSSSRIRELLAAGDVRGAALLLGAPYLAAGTVLQGEQRGRTIGFPTANLETGARKALPPGVFSVLVDAGGRRYGGMANVGPRPTFPDSVPSLEVHLFGFSGDLYGQQLRVHFIDRIRSQARFASLGELQAQLARDRETAGRQLAGMIPG